VADSSILPVIFIEQNVKHRIHAAAIFLSSIVKKDALRKTA